MDKIGHTDSATDGRTDGREDGHSDSNTPPPPFKNKERKKKQRERKKKWPTTAAVKEKLNGQAACQKCSWEQKMQGIKIHTMHIIGCLIFGWNALRPRP